MSAPDLKQLKFSKESTERKHNSESCIRFPEFLLHDQSTGRFVRGFTDEKQPATAQYRTQQAFTLRALYLRNVLSFKSPDDVVSGERIQAYARAQWAEMGEAPIPEPFVLEYLNARHCLIPLSHAGTPRMRWRSAREYLDLFDPYTETGRQADLDPTDEGGSDAATAHEFMMESRANKYTQTTAARRKQWREFWDAAVSELDSRLAGVQPRKFTVRRKFVVT